MGRLEIVKSSTYFTTVKQHVMLQKLSFHSQLLPVNLSFMILSTAFYPSSIKQMSVWGCVCIGRYDPGYHITCLASALNDGYFSQCQIPSLLANAQSNWSCKWLWFSWKNWGWTLSDNGRMNRLFTKTTNTINTATESEPSPCSLFFFHTCLPVVLGEQNWW